MPSPAPCVPVVLSFLLASLRPGAPPFVQRAGAGGARGGTLPRQTHGRVRAGRSGACVVHPSVRACALSRSVRVVLARVPVRPQNHTTLVDGYLGMSNDEERSEMRYVVRIAEFSESSNL